MNTRIAYIFSLFLAILFFLHSISAQTVCSGKKLLTEKNCPGDEVGKTETELFRLINDYRAKNGLPAVELSTPLSLVANRHLLDLKYNVRFFTHGWSDCPYDIKDQKTWGCLFEAPQRLQTGYAGSGFENLYRNLNGLATPELALEAWKKSPMHNALILNLDVWKDTKFDAFGLAIDGNYACIWFGSAGAGQVKTANQNQGLGVSFAKVVEGLTSVIAIQKTSSVLESDRWVGKSADKTVTLELIGRQEDIAETTMALSLKLGKDLQITQKNRNILSVFIKNLTGNWAERERWLDSALEKLTKKQNNSLTINVQNMTIELNLGPENVLTVIVRPESKPTAKELE